MQIKIDSKLITIADEDYYDGIEEDLEHELRWADIQHNMHELSEVQQEALQRWADLEALQKHYTNFADFLYDAMNEVMGYDCSDIQIDIGDYLQFGPKYLMIQAQRSQAKSTIVAIFVVWSLIHNPKARNLIISAGSEVATEIAGYVIQIIMNWEILTCLRPDRQHGDRASTKSFDVHWQLKGVEKSPSVACIGITANMQGRRADNLIADDIESSKNGMTEIQRQQLIHKSRDFTSICQNGRILYLGTPQTNDSVYNTLPGRGFSIRIWPGRYPTIEEESNYGDFLAPFIRKKMEADPNLRSGFGLTGDAGVAIDPLLLPEKLLIAKELDQGPAYFQLQHMLNTKLSDEDRYPLNTRNLIIMQMNLEKAPGEIIWMPDKNKSIQISGIPDSVDLYEPFSVSQDLYDYEGKYVYVDTAGGGTNGDETVACAMYFLHGYLFVAELLALPGGYSPEVFEELSAFIYKHQPNEIGVEQNHGYGAFAQGWRPVLQGYFKSQTGSPHCPVIIDDWVSAQKELRIIDTLEPIMARHRLIVNLDVIKYDIKSTQSKPIDSRVTYTLTNQINKITRDHNALIHDDRLDAIAAAARKYMDYMAINEQLRMQQKTSSENMQMMQEWNKEKSPIGLANIKRFRGSPTRRMARRKR